MDCKNCHKPLNDIQKFCDYCGAKVIQNRLKPKILAQQVNEEFLSVDNKFLKTLIHLFTKPELVINGYIEGTRKKYINVIQYFAIALTLLGIQVFFMSSVFTDPELYRFEFMDNLTKGTNQDNNPFGAQSFEQMNSFQSLANTIGVPFSAIATFIAYWVAGLRQFNFTEHLVINLYYGAQIVIISALIYIISLAFGFNYFGTSLYITVLTYIYFFYVLKRVFQTTFRNTVLPFIIVIAASVFIFLALTIFITIIAFIGVLIYKISQ
tara:strand:+ start:2188 stop:2985 length:798 start_codon:yes stop_codon:yes gene_type:complete